MRQAMLLLTLVGAVLLACTGVVLAQQTDRGEQRQSAGGQAEPEDFAPGEVLVKFEPGTRGQAQAEAHRQAGGQVKDTIPGIDVKVVGVPAGTERTSLARYQRNPNVQYAELNGVYQAIEPKDEKTNSDDEATGEKTDGEPTGETTPDASTNATPSDQYYAQQWQYPNIHAPEAWDVTPGSTDVPIAILDTGISQDHPDLPTSKVTQTKNFTNATADDKNGHGSHTAGSAAAATNNGTTGVAGTCWECPLWNYKVLGNSGSGSWSWIASGITTAATDGAKVISMSLGGSSNSQTVHDAVNYAWGFNDDSTPYITSNGTPSDKRAVVVAAAGNDGTEDAAHYPSNYKNVISVAATDSSDNMAWFSNYGNEVDVAAPGVSIYSTYKGTSYKTLSGTSMATPHVAGVAGLVWSRGALLCNDSDNACVRRQIESKAEPITGTGSLWTYGRINAYSSLTP